MSKKDIFKKFSPAIVLVLTAIGSNFASAQNPTPLGVDWQCVQQDDDLFNVLCIPEPTGSGSIAPESVSGTVKASPPGERDMRPVAERGLAEVFSATAWSVPLYTRPSDTVMVTRLLDSVLCDTAPRCTVSYRSN